MPSILMHALTGTAYGALGFHFWRSRWRDQAQPPQKLNLIEQVLLLVVATAHAALLQASLLKGGALHFGLGLALSSMLWLAVLFYWLESFHSRMEGLMALILPLAAIAVLLPALLPGSRPMSHATQIGFRLHLLAGMLAYGLFTVATLHALLMAVFERRLRSGQLNLALNALPPLLTMESQLFRLLRVAFGLLTLTMLSGAVFSEELFGRAFHLDHKTVFGFLSWLIFGALLLGRKLRGWRGRKAVAWTIAGFTALLLAYVGSRFVVEVVLQRS